jgi:hypothetical protein
MSQTSTETAFSPSNARQRYVMAALLLEKWMIEDTDYDDRVWPTLEETLNNSGLQ